MADPTDRWPDNARGRYYVDGNCIASKFCVAAAAGNIRMADGGHAYVYRQPETPEEEAACQRALAGCPVNAIGDDGEPQ